MAPECLVVDLEGHHSSTINIAKCPSCIWGTTSVDILLLRVDNIEDEKKKREPPATSTHICIQARSLCMPSVQEMLHSMDGKLLARHNSSIHPSYPCRSISLNGHLRHLWWIYHLTDKQGWLTGHHAVKHASSRPLYPGVINACSRVKGLG